MLKKKILMLLLGTGYQIPAPTYGILWQSRLRPGDPKVWVYAVRIEEYADKEELKQLVCRLVKERKPTGYDTLRIHFYYRLDEFVPDISLPEQTRINVAHIVATYSWNEYWAKESGAGKLLIRKGKSGTSLPKEETVPFDHRSSCGIQ